MNTRHRSPRVAREAEHLAAFLPGASPRHPVELTSASLVEVRAASTPCPLCQGPLRIQRHDVADGPDGRPLREVEVKCWMCGTDRTLYFRIVRAAAPN